MTIKKILLLLCVLISSFGIAQKTSSQFKKVYNYDEYKKGWALVKSIANTYGFIDRNGNEVVQTVYSKIYKFEEKKDHKNYAMIKNVAGAYGFIDENGKEIVEAIYWKKEEAYQKLDLYIKKQAL
jgi:WG containing repeat